MGKAQPIPKTCAHPNTHYFSYLYAFQHISAKKAQSPPSANKHILPSVSNMTS